MLHRRCGQRRHRPYDCHTEAFRRIQLAIFPCRAGLKWPVVGASLFATNIGAEHLVGLSGDAYRYGLSAGTVELTTCICLGIACACAFSLLHEHQDITPSRNSWNSAYNRTARVFFSGLMLVICIMTKLAFHYTPAPWYCMGSSAGM